MHPYRSVLVTCFTLVLVLFASCSWISRKSITNQYYKDRGELIVLTRNSPVSYYEDRTGSAVGFEHDLVQEFAKEMNVNARFVVKDSLEEIYNELRIGSAHLAAAGIESDRPSSSEFLFGPSLAEVTKAVVCHKNSKIYRRKHLKGKKVAVVFDEEEAEVIKRLRKKHPSVKWVDDGGEPLTYWIESVKNKQIDCIVTHSLLLNSDQVHLAGLRSTFDIGSESELGWSLARGQERLLEDLKTWALASKKNELFVKTKERYFGTRSEYDFYDTEVYLKRIKRVLPKLRAKFEAAGEAVQLDWRLLAAVGYQESHWNAIARSPTGVRGIMMLTRTTAKEVGVEDRLDPAQSIRGGSVYLRRILNRVPKYIAEKDRLWFALAAYNVGWAHLKDARKLSIDLGKNPNLWEDLSSVLPLLTRAKYYKKLEHGYAQGYEPVTYVARIRRYYDLLKAEIPQ